MIDFTAEQKVRYKLTGHPYQEPHFQHEGSDVTRWLTGGPAPTALVQFQHEGDLTIVCCSQCGRKLGQLNMNSENASRKIAKIRRIGTEHQQQHQNG